MAWLGSIDESIHPLESLHWILKELLLIRAFYFPYFGIQGGKSGTPGVTALELIKRAYESNTLDKLRDFLSIEPQPVTG